MGMVPEKLVELIFYEIATALILVIIALVLIIWQLLKKYVVTVTVVTVKTDNTQYDHAATVNISGTVNIDTVPQSGATVSLKVVDSNGVEFDLPDVVTAADGSFTAAWVIPSTVASGTCTLTATALGVSATATFRFNNKEEEEERRRR
jgi:hypothetical protein